MLWPEGPINTARNPSAAIAAGYPAARQQVALADRNATTCDAAALIPSAAAPPTDPRREGIQARAIRTSGIAVVRHVLITHPDCVYGTDRRGRTALHPPPTLDSPRSPLSSAPHALSSTHETEMDTRPSTPRNIEPHAHPSAL